MTAPNYRLVLNSHGVWTIRWSEQVEGLPGAWRTKRVSTRIRDRYEAEQCLQGFVAEATRIAAAEQRGTLAGFAADYLAAIEHRGAGDTQRRALAPVLKALGTRVPTQLTAAVLSEYRRGRSVADGTLRRELGALNAALAYAERHKALSAADRPHIELPPPGAARDLWLDEREEADFLDLALATSTGRGRLSRVARFVALALDTAARRGAIEGLAWSRVDLAARRIDFRDPARAVTKKRRVMLPVSDRLLPVLERARWEATRDGLEDSAPVIGRGSIRSAYDAWTDAPGFPFPWVTPHVMRHTWATLAARRGVSMFEIAGVLGDTVDTVSAHYLHHSPGHLMAAVNRPAVSSPLGVSP